MQVDKYATFAKASADDVVNSALERVFSKDKNFLEHLEKNPEPAVPETLRVKSTEESPIAAKRGPKAKNDAAGHSNCSRSSNINRNDRGRNSWKGKNKMNVLRTWRKLTLHP